MTSRWTKPARWIASSAAPACATIARRVGRVQRAARAHQRAQVAARDVAHRDVGDPVLLARLVHGDHVRVVDAGRGARLGQEAPPDVLVVQQFRRDHLERHDPLQGELPRPVDDAHPAAPDHRLDPVTGHDGAGLERAHRCCIAETEKLGNASEPVGASVRMHPRGPEQTPLQDPPPDGRHLLPRPGHGRPGRSESNTFPASTPYPSSTSRVTATRTRTRSPPPSATPS